MFISILREAGILTLKSLLNSMVFFFLTLPVTRDPSQGAFKSIEHVGGKLVVKHT